MRGLTLGDPALVGRPAAVGGVTPMFWLDASDAASITASSGAVSQWNDKSASGLNVVQATGTAKPSTGAATVNGLNVIRFDGGDVLTHTGTTGLNVGAVTVLIVARQNVDATGTGLLSVHASAGNDWNSANAFVLETGDNANLFTAARSTTFPSIAGAGVSPLRIYAVRMSSAGLMEVWSNGGTAVSATGGSSFGVANGGIVVGGRFLSGAVAGTNRINGDIGEIRVFGSVLSNADLNAVGDELATKWGLTWTAV